MQDNNSNLSQNKLVEGVHYYINQQGYWVFTEAYHLARGYCCKSGCKHCPYGFAKKG
ncbi:MAG: hypothetical protein KBE91_05145 [Bacteroidia bacterium]|nr:hypothetical protein [Bacteroidia bacterium]MBP9688977.1 hypothetical protein [Bacteroidia bacterium]